jgi:hypothetical protein
MADQLVALHATKNYVACHKTGSYLVQNISYNLMMCCGGASKVAFV